MTSYKPQVQVSGEGDKWHSNGLAFATEQEAAASAADLAGRWLLVTGHRATPSDEEPNYRWTAQGLERIEAVKRGGA